MPVYRLFPIATTGLIADTPIIIDAIHDKAALTQSERMRDDRTREVWRGEGLSAWCWADRLEINSPQPEPHSAAHLVPGDGWSGAAERESVANRAPDAPLVDASKPQRILASYTTRAKCSHLL